MDESVLQRTIVALDTLVLEEACAWVAQYHHRVHAFKVGVGLILRYGLDGLQPLCEAGAERIFLDLKLHDIPHAVGLAVRQVSQYGIWMLTVHASGGEAMLRASVEASRECPARPLLIGVTVLTSLDRCALQAVGVARTPKAQVLRLSRLAHRCGLDGVVASPHEARILRRHLPSPFLIVTPGVRPAGSDQTDDQRRVATPEQALRWGADFVVMGRALTHPTTNR
ncbi:MAG: orotidine-5'-phosphate decarboxylase [Armatimonadota bacterium]